MRPQSECLTCCIDIRCSRGYPHLVSGAPVTRQPSDQSPVSQSPAPSARTVSSHTAPKRHTLLPPVPRTASQVITTRTLTPHPHITHLPPTVARTPHATHLLRPVDFHSSSSCSFPLPRHAATWASRGYGKVPLSSASHFGRDGGTSPRGYHSLRMSYGDIASFKCPVSTPTHASCIHSYVCLLYPLLRLPYACLAKTV